MVIYRAPKWLFRALRKHAGAIGAFTNVLTATISDVAFLQKVARGVFLTVLGSVCWLPECE